MIASVYITKGNNNFFYLRKGEAKTNPKNHPARNCNPRRNVGKKKKKTAKKESSKEK
jgi:hypothetical protein